MIENTMPIRVAWFYYIEGNKTQNGEWYIAQYCSYFTRRIAVFVRLYGDKRIF